MTVMAGVSLVGFSGSLVKDTLRSTAFSFVNMLDPTAPTIDLPANGTVEDTEAAKVVIGICRTFSMYPPSLTHFDHFQVSFSFCLHKFCQST